MSKDFTNGRRVSAFSLIELISITAVLFLAGLLVINSLPRLYNPKAKAPRIKCTNNLKNVGLAARIYATDNDGLFPGAYFLSNKTDLGLIDAATYFRMLSNQLSTPKIIVCPADKRRKEAASFTNLSTANVSYFASLTAREDLLGAFLAGDRNLQFTNGQAIPRGLFTLTTNNLNLSWSGDLHKGQGNISMGDGSVQQFSSNRLKQGIRDQDPSTNLLLVP